MDILSHIYCKSCNDVSLKRLKINDKTGPGLVHFLKKTIESHVMVKVTYSPCSSSTLTICIRMGSGCGTFGRSVAASNTRGPGDRSSHQQFVLQNCLLLKMQRMAHVKISWESNIRIGVKNSLMLQVGSNRSRQIMQDRRPARKESREVACGIVSPRRGSITVRLTYCLTG